MPRFFRRAAACVGLIASAALTPAGCGITQSTAPDCRQLTDSKAWVRQAPAGAQSMAGYFTLTNTGSQPVTINGVSSTQFGSAELHQTIDKNGHAHMKPLNHVTIAAGQTLRFEPGGRHVMLIDPSQRYDAGDQVEMVLSCGRRHAELAVAAIVRAAQPGSHDGTVFNSDNENRAQVLKDGQTGGGADATDDSKTAGRGT